jgi:hypothetical protein
MLGCQVEFNRFLNSFFPSLKVIAEVRAIGLFFPFFLKKKMKRSKVIVLTSFNFVISNSFT